MEDAILDKLSSIEAELHELTLPEVPSGITARIQVRSVSRTDTEQVDLGVRVKGGPEHLGPVLVKHVELGRSLGINTVYDLGSALSVSLDPSFKVTLMKIPTPDFIYSISMGAGIDCLELLKRTNEHYSVLYTGDITNFSLKEL